MTPAEEQVSFGGCLLPVHSSQVVIPDELVVVGPLGVARGLAPFEDSGEGEVVLIRVVVETCLEQSLHLLQVIP